MATPRNIIEPHDKFKVNQYLSNLLNSYIKRLKNLSQRILSSQYHMNDEICGLINLIITYSKDIMSVYDTILSSFADYKRKYHRDSVAHLLTKEKLIQVLHNKTNSKIDSKACNANAMNFHILQLCAYIISQYDALYAYYNKQSNVDLHIYFLQHYGHYIRTLSTYLQKYRMMKKVTFDSKPKNGKQGGSKRMKKTISKKQDTVSTSHSV
jgi:hypothetical protein